MKELRDELDRFLEWCGLTELEYRMGYRPRIDADIFEGWEWLHYPFWEEMDKAFMIALKKGDFTITREIALAISIDWESSTLQDKLLGSMYAYQAEVYVEILTNPGPATLTYFWEALAGPFAAVSSELLPTYISKERRGYVAKLALHLLLEVNQRIALETAERMVAHPDPSMRLACLKVLFDHDKAAFTSIERLFPHTMRADFEAEAESIGLPKSFWNPESA